MKSAMLYGKEQVRVTDIPQPQIGSREILLKVKAASLCGSDVRMIQNGYKNVDENHPLTLGHEFAGIIEEVGGEIQSYTTGVRVTVAPNWGCGICRHCTGGDTHLCRDYQAFGINRPGGFAEYVVIPEEVIRQGNIVPMGEALSFEEASLVEPFSCVMNGQERTGIQAGDTVLVVGAGPIGILHAMLAGITGASKVMMNDLSNDRLRVAKELIPDLITIEGDPARRVMEETNGLGVDVSIIAAPAPTAQEESLAYMAMNGRVLFFGGLPGDREQISLNSNIVHYKQLRIVGSARANVRQFRICLSFVQNGRIPIGRLVTGRYSIDEFANAVAAAKQASGLKHVIVFD